MPDATPRPVLTAFDWVPEFARGLVRDLRVRWALEEIGRPYDTDLLSARQPRPEDYLVRQPFDQVPAFRDGDLQIFETGAILLYLGEQDERLLPTEPQARWNSIAWLFSALNSVEPFVGRITTYDLFHKDKDWMPAAREASLGLCQGMARGPVLGGRHRHGDGAQQPAPHRPHRRIPHTRRIQGAWRGSAGVQACARSAVRRLRG